MFISISSRASAQTPTPISACGDVSGSVILTADISSNQGVCLKVVGDNTTIDGNHHTAAATGAPSDNWAVYDTNHAHLTVQNLASSQGIYIYGASDFSLIQQSTLGSVVIVGADDVTVDHNNLNSLSAYPLGTDSTFRTHITNNTISGYDETLVNLYGAANPTCPDANTDFVVTDNVMTSGYQCGGTGQPACNEPKVLFFRCSSGNIVSRNIIHSTGQAMPGRFRDAFDDSTVSDNTFWASGNLGPDGAFGALNITSGNVDKHFPQNNVFTRNIIRSDQNNAFYFEVTGPNNTFSFNTFIANSPNYVGIFGGGAGGSTLDHNTFYNAANGPVIGFSSRSSSFTNTFTNNIFSGSGSIYTFDCSDPLLNYCTPSYYQADYNLFTNRGGTAAFGIFGSSLASLQAFVTPDDAHSREANPQFTNTANRDFSFPLGSPAYHAASDGTNIGAWQGTMCTEDWTTVPCSGWSACFGGTQTRTCTDTNHCGTTNYQPALSQSCSVPDQTAPAQVFDLRTT